MRSLERIDRLLARLEASKAGEQRVDVDPFAPNVICSRCAIGSFWPDLESCPVCGARTGRKLGPNAWGSWPLDDTPYGCPRCGSEHVGRDRTPSPLETRCGCCPACGFDPLSRAVPGHDPQGNPGMYVYRPSPPAYVVIVGDEPVPPGSLVIDIDDIDELTN